jgi:N-acetylneuraminic acid mutarotase
METTAIPIPATKIPPIPTDVPTATLMPTATLTPTDIPSMNPSPRAYISLAYDTESKLIILFGGQLGNYRLASNYVNDTWVYDADANKWTEMKPSNSPGKRSAAALAYDAESDRVILFGGANMTTWGMSDTWAYDYNTNTWTQMANGPTKHLGARLAYDAESDRIILFGGFNMSGFLYDDTWAYDFNSDTWTEMKPAINPPGRNYQAMTYDSKADRILTWGGTDANGTPLDANIWAYDYNTNTWQELAPGDGAHPVVRDYSAMAYDPESDRTVVYGGVRLGSGETGNETWAYNYNTNTWMNLQPSAAPDKRSRHAMAYNAATNKIILFGGEVGPLEFDYTGETWIYDTSANTWTNIMPQP